MKTFWYVKGDYDDILNILKLYLSTTQYENFKDDSYSYRYKRNIGAYISNNSDNDSRYSYYIFQNKNKKEAWKIYSRKNPDQADYHFMGELRIENEVLIKDTLMADLLIYNL